MPKTKKLLALALVLVMMFSLSISAFATNNGTATIDVLMEGVTLFENGPETILFSSDTTVKDVLDEYYADYLELQWKSVINENPRFTVGSTAYVIESIYGTESVGTPNAEGVTAQFWSSAYPGYGIVSTELVDGKTLYHYVYAGYDWEFKVNGVHPTDPTYTMADGTAYEYYADQYTIQNGDVITIEYTYQVIYWDSYDRILVS